MGREGLNFTCLGLLVGQPCPKVKWQGHPERSPLFSWPKISVPVFSESPGTQGCPAQEVRVARACGEEVGCVDVSVVTT